MIIERKTSKDFISSIFNERMFQQVNKITSFTNKAILLIEGKLKNDTNKQQLNIIASIPFIGEKYAERLLKSFKAIKNIINQEFLIKL